MTPQTILSFLIDRAKQTPDTVAHWTLNTNSKWEPTTWSQYHRKVVQLTTGLRQIGLVPGDRIGIMAPTNQEWDFFQMAILMAGGIVVGIDPHDRLENIHLIIESSGLTGLVFGEIGYLNKIATGDQDRFRFMVSIKDDPNQRGNPKISPLSNLAERGDSAETVPFEIPEPQWPATIIFTSGTTGAPKGILYTHGQVFLACEAIRTTFSNITEGSRLVCWLPLSNLFQRIINFCAIRIGAQTYYVTNPSQVMAHLPSISPHLFIAVPRFYEKLYEGVQKTISQKPRLISLGFKLAHMIGDRYARHLRDKRPPNPFVKLLHPLAELLFFKKIRRMMGTDLHFMISGSAPMPLWLLEWFHAMGLLILEAYGISENIIPNAANRPDAYQFGTVGKALPGNDLFISDDGELWIKGEGVYHGYLDGKVNQAELTDSGYLATGDFVSIDKEGFITLTGRKSDIFKTSTGRRIAPVGIENVLRQIPYIDHAVVLGAGRKFLTAILSISTSIFAETYPDAGNLENTAGGKNTSTVEDRLREDIVRQVASLPAYQRPAGFIVTTHPFTIEGQELTSNLKVRRKYIENKFSDQLVLLYNAIDETTSSERIVIRRI